MAKNSSDKVYLIIAKNRKLNKNKDLKTGTLPAK
jgi:hypothetical protein